MTTLDTTSTTAAPFGWDRLDDAEQAAAAFLARYSGRTLDSYHHDLLTVFRWASDMGILVLKTAPPHIELYRVALEERGLAPSTIDRRLSTVCGFYRFAHINGRVSSNPAQYARRPKVHPTEGHGMDRGEVGTFRFTAEGYDHAHAGLAVHLGLNGLRVSEACATNVENLTLERGHWTLRIIGKGNKPAIIPLVPRAARTIDRAVEERHEGPRRPPSRSAHDPPMGKGHWEAGRAGIRPPPHAPLGLHHGGPGCRRPPEGRPDSRPARRSEDYHYL